MAPKDLIEATLVAQIAIVNLSIMSIATELTEILRLEMFMKLSRTHTALVDALKRYRTGGEQKVTVQHVSVSEGGQAIVGNVTQAANGNARHKAVSTPALTHDKTAPMPIVEDTKVRAPVSVRRNLKK